MVIRSILENSSKFFPNFPGIWQHRPFLRNENSSLEFESCWRENFIEFLFIRTKRNGDKIDSRKFLIGRIIELEEESWDVDKIVGEVKWFAWMQARSFFLATC